MTIPAERAAAGDTAGDRLREEADFQNRRVATHQPEARDKFYFLAQRAIQRYQSYLAEPAGKRVLVVGCSQGGVTPLARAGATVVGIDIAEEPVARLRAAIATEGLGERARALVMDAEAADFPARSFDLICCTGVLHHLDVERAARTWSQILAPTGAVVMLEPLAWSPAAALYRWLTPEARTPYEHPLKPGDIRVLRQHFARVDMESYAFTSTLAAVWAFLPRLVVLRTATLRVLEALDTMLFWLVPALKHLAWTSVIRCAEPIQE